METKIDSAVMQMAYYLRRAMNKTTSQYGISGPQARFIGFIAEQKQAVYQKDIEKAFNIRRSTASGILKHLEEAGLISREVVSKDARLKKIALSAKGRSLKRDVSITIKENDAMMRRGLTIEEQTQFIALANKIIEDVKSKEGDDCENHKDIK